MMAKADKLTTDDLQLPRPRTGASVLGDAVKGMQARRRNTDPPGPPPQVTPSPPASLPPDPLVEPDPGPDQETDVTSSRSRWKQGRGPRTELVLDRETTRLVNDSLYMIGDKVGVTPKRTEVFEALVAVYVQHILPRIELLEDARVRDTRPLAGDYEGRDHLVAELTTMIETAVMQLPK